MIDPKKGQSMKTEETILALRLVLKGSAAEFVGSSADLQHEYFDLVEDPWDAYDFTMESDEAKWKAISAVTLHHCEIGESVEFVYIKKSIEIENETNNEFLKELMVRAALEKLSEKEIKVLGIMNLFTYIKTKYHES